MPMNKSKIVKKSGISRLVIKSLKGQQLNENEVYAINSNKVNGLLHIDVIQKGSSFKLIYNITGLITLQEYLSVPLNKEKFAGMLKNILANLKSMENAYLNQQYLIMDFNRVMVNPATQSIYFIYVPIQFFEGGSSLKEFLLNIIQHASFVSGEDTNYVKDYITILNRGINFSVFELEEYVNKLLGQRVLIRHGTECPHCHTQFEKKTNHCYFCGAKISSDVGNGVYDPLDYVERKEILKEQDLFGEKRVKDNTQGFSDGTTILGSDSDDTTMLDAENFEQFNYPYLIRQRTGEKIFIDKQFFRIGKEYSDYAVSDNSAVSRKHADIVTRERRYYIVDLDSKNKTYVNGKIVPAGKEIEIFSGVKLRLANEEFVFHAEK